MAGGIYFYRVSRCLIDTRLRPIYRNRVGIWRFSFIEYGRDIVGINVSFFYFRVGIALGRRELFVQFAIAIQVISIEDKRFIGHIGCNKLYIVDEQTDFARRYTVDCDIFGIVRQFEAVFVVSVFRISLQSIGDDCFATFEDYEVVDVVVAGRVHDLELVIAFSSIHKRN